MVKSDDQIDVRAKERNNIIGDCDRIMKFQFLLMFFEDGLPGKFAHQSDHSNALAIEVENVKGTKNGEIIWVRDVSA